jgi:hypothetical protein
MLSGRHAAPELIADIPAKRGSVEPRRTRSVRRGFSADQ